MTFATAVPILFTSFVYHTNVYWSVIHGIKRKPHLSVVWNWYHFVAIAILHQPRPTDSADIYTRLQLSDTSSIPPMHGGFLLWSRGARGRRCRIGFVWRTVSRNLHVLETARTLGCASWWAQDVGVYMHFVAGVGSVFWGSCLFDLWVPWL